VRSFADQAASALAASALAASALAASALDFGELSRAAAQSCRQWHPAWFKKNRRRKAGGSYDA